MTMVSTPFAFDLLRDLLRGLTGFNRLTAGHRDRIIVQNLVSDIGARGDRRADRKRA